MEGGEGRRGEGADKAFKRDDWQEMSLNGRWMRRALAVSIEYELELFHIGGYGHVHKER